MNPIPSGPLEDIHVSDFMRMPAGPSATMLPDDYGAEIVKIEHPVKGDPTRKIGPFSKYDPEHPTAGRLKIVGMPAEPSGTPGRIKRPAPLLGERTADILMSVPDECFGILWR